jgi:hypothetical protein
MFYTASRDRVVENRLSIWRAASWIVLAVAVWGLWQLRSAMAHHHRLTVVQIRNWAVLGVGAVVISRLLSWVDRWKRIRAAREKTV